MDAARKKLPKELLFTGINRLSGDREGNILLEERDATPLEPDEAVGPFFWREMRNASLSLFLAAAVLAPLAYHAYQNYGEVLGTVLFLLLFTGSGAYFDAKEKANPYHRFHFTKVMELSPQEENAAYARLYQQYKKLLSQVELHKFQGTEDSLWGASSLELDQHIDAFYEEFEALEEEATAFAEAQEEVAVRRLYSTEKKTEALPPVASQVSELLPHNLTSVPALSPSLHSTATTERNSS